MLYNKIMTEYAPNTGNTAFDVYLKGFFHSAETFPRSSVSVGLFGGELLDEIEAGRLSIVQLTTFPDQIQGPVHDELLTNITERHREFDVPDFEELRQGGIRRGAGLTVSTFVSSLAQLFLRPNGGEELPNIAKPGWADDEPAGLDEVLRDPAAMQKAKDIFALVKATLESGPAQIAASSYRNGVSPEGSLGIATVAATHGAPAKYGFFAKASQDLVSAVRPMVQDTLRAHAEALGITPRAAEIFGHNITRTMPDEPWLPKPPQH